MENSINDPREEKGCHGCGRIWQYYIVFDGLLSTGLYVCVSEGGREGGSE